MSLKFIYVQLHRFSEPKERFLVIYELSPHHSDEDMIAKEEEWLIQFVPSCVYVINICYTWASHFIRFSRSNSDCISSLSPWKLSIHWSLKVNTLRTPPLGISWAQKKIVYIVLQVQPVLWGWVQIQHHCLYDHGRLSSLCCSSISFL